MPLTEPIVFEPLFMERVWGGRRLESLYGKDLPQGVRVGESWEIVDREEAQSVVHAGELRGMTLNELWMKHRAAVFGAKVKDARRFPLLFKLLDAQERLSVQVHPPASLAERFGGEPKTEMWYFLDTQPDSDLYAGLKRGVTRMAFEAALKEGNIAELIHRLPSHNGDAVFIPSGRIHAIGEGNVIFEVQQNSDTTYRVFDWNRLGLDGRPRDLHIHESLESIDFNDPEPAPVQRDGETVVACPEFRVERWEIAGSREAAAKGREEFAIFFVEKGEVSCGTESFSAGKFFLVPAEWSDARLRSVSAAPAAVLRTTIDPVRD